MKKYFYTLVLAVVAAICIVPDSTACTSAIISGRLTPDGRPLLWKHRDTKMLENRVDYVAKTKDTKYAFVAVINCTTRQEYSWMGTNEVGFSIINTASSSMRKFPEDSTDHEGIIMYKALGQCRTIAEFEAFLEANKPLCVETNYGVIDAEGGAAYFETNSYEWTKQDVNDPAVAPLGYKVYTNFSPVAGKQDTGGGYIRYATANAKLQSAALSYTKITPQWIFNNLSRSYYHSLLDIDLTEQPEMVSNGWFYDMDFIPRKSTASSAVIKGVKPGENPLLTTMWVVLGYPPVSVAVPTMVAAGTDQPKVVTRHGKKEPTCPMSDIAKERRAKVFPITRGSGPNYLHFSVVYNQEGTGYMQRLAPYEDAVVKSFDEIQAKWYEAGKVNVAEFKAFHEAADFGMDVK